MKRLNKKTISLVIAGLIVTGGGVAAVTSLLRPTEQQRSAVSTHKTIQLTTKVPLLKNGTEIAGTYLPKKNQALMYSVTNDGKLLGAGTILPDKKGAFSRNVAFVSKISKRTAALLKIYSQDTNGKIIDELSIVTNVE